MTIIWVVKGWPNTFHDDNSPHIKELYNGEPTKRENLSSVLLFMESIW